MNGLLEEDGLIGEIEVEEQFDCDKQVIDTFIGELDETESRALEAFAAGDAVMEGLVYEGIKRKFCQFVKNYGLGEENFDFETGETICKIAIANRRKKKEKKKEAKKFEFEKKAKKEKRASEMKIQWVGDLKSKRVDLIKHAQNCPPIRRRRIEDQTYLEKYFRRGRDEL